MEAGLLTTAYRLADKRPAPPAELILTVELNFGTCQWLLDVVRGELRW